MICPRDLSACTVSKYPCGAQGARESRVCARVCVRLGLGAYKHTSVQAHTGAYTNSKERTRTQARTRIQERTRVQERAHIQARSLSLKRTDANASTRSHHSPSLSLAGHRCCASPSLIVRPLSASFPVISCAHARARAHTHTHTHLTGRRQLGVTPGAPCEQARLRRLALDTLNALDDRPGYAGWACHC